MSRPSYPDADADALTAALHLRFSHGTPEPTAAPAGETALRSKPVRITVDLAPELYHRLTRWTAGAAEEIDVAKLPLADVMRAFIRAADDPAVRSRVLDELRTLKQ